MKTLREAVGDYLMMRRGLGFKLRHVEHDLGSFVSFMELEKAPFIRWDLALKWAMAPTDVRPAYWAQRLSAVRGFARYRSATDPRTQVPSEGLLPFQNQRTQPYLYTDEDIERLMTAAKTLRPRDGLRSWTYYCLFGLLTVTGLRISELIALERRDVDLREGLLMIRGTKFGKSRIVPLHDSTRHALADYAHRRDRHPDRQSAVKFLVSDHGGPLEASTVRRTFYHLSRKTGLRRAGDRHGPRLHDFRHRLATSTLLECTALVRMLNAFYLFWRPTWDTAMSKTLIGICRVVRSLWDMRYDDWRNVGRRSYEGIKLSDTAATLLHSASDGSTTGQSAHDRFVSRYVPPPARLRSKGNT